MLATRDTGARGGRRHSPRTPRVPMVLDPVLAASSGGALLDAAGRSALRAVLLPRATLLTPNIPEAAALLGAPCRAHRGGAARAGAQPAGARGTRGAAEGRARQRAEAVDLLL